MPTTPKDKSSYRARKKIIITAIVVVAVLFGVLFTFAPNRAEVTRDAYIGSPKLEIINPGITGTEIPIHGGTLTASTYSMEKTNLLP